MQQIFIAFFVFMAASLSGQSAEWQHFYPDGAAYSIAARGNDILACTNGERGFTRFDTFGNPTFFDATNSGLPFNFVSQVAVDHAGDWWVGYKGGIGRYDGSNWTIWDTTQLGVPFFSASMTVIRPSPGGRVGAGTGTQGGALYENGSWATLTTANSGLPSNNIRDIAFGADEKAYFATNAGLAVLDGNAWTVYNAASTGISIFNDIKSVAVTSAGIVWVTVGINRFAKLEGGTWTTYTQSDIGLTGVGLVGRVEVDEQDRLWLSFSKSISVLEGTAWTHHLEGEIGCIIPVSLAGIKMAIDGAGQLWSTACGLTKFDGQNWEQLHIGNSLLPNTVYAITRDTAGNMWFAGRNGGDYQLIAKKEGDNWQTFNPMELGLSDTITEIWTAHGDKFGNVWFAMLTGEILRYDGSAWSVFDTIATTYPTIADIWTVNSAPDGSVWFSCLVEFVGPSLVRNKNGEWTFFTAPTIPIPTNRFVTSMAFGSDNAAWFLTNASDNLLKFDGAGWAPVDLANTGLSFNFIRQIATAPDDALWLATDGGAVRFDGAAWTAVSTANSDIPSDDIYRIAFDQAGGMYVGFNPAGITANVAVLRSGVWALLIPPGFEPGFSNEPFELFAGPDNRLWFNGFQGAPPVFAYDPMLVSTKDPAATVGPLNVFPNPASGVIYLQMTGWENQRVQVVVRNAQGGLLLQQTTAIEDEFVVLNLPPHSSAGVYYLEVINEKGAQRSGRFVRTLQH